MEAETEVDKVSTEEKRIPDILSSANDLAAEPMTDTLPGDRVTAETNIEKNVETAVTATKDVPEIVTEPEPKSNLSTWLIL